MKIKEEEAKFIITPTALLKVEERYPEFDFLKLLREALNENKEPKMSDYFKVLYVGYIGAKPEEEITFDEFLKLLEEIDFGEITQVGVKLLTERKN